MWNLHKELFKDIKAVYFKFKQLFVCLQFKFPAVEYFSVHIINETQLYVTFILNVISILTNVEGDI